MENDIKALEMDLNNSRVPQCGARRGISGAEAAARAARARSARAAAERERRDRTHRLMEALQSGSAFSRERPRKKANPRVAGGMRNTI
ncbi:hypothetical protein HF086_014656 [Spodoptera exigua]|uniref:Uncharacterized protein n=1 Tax=Spodoptera exigua TaxID=7107 RepID=A0A922M711_SPOEX|nr:hypothetical protein HF086_014656 [Spodoptera exigua]